MDRVIDDATGIRDRQGTYKSLVTIFRSAAALEAGLDDSLTQANVLFALWDGHDVNECVSGGKVMNKGGDKRKK